MRDLRLLQDLLIKFFTLTIKILEKIKKTFKISLMRKSISPLNLNVQASKRKYEKLFFISWSGSDTLYGKEPKFEP